MSDQTIFTTVTKLNFEDLTNDLPNPLCDACKTREADYVVRLSTHSECHVFDKKRWLECKRCIRRPKRCRSCDFKPLFSEVVEIL